MPIIDEKRILGNYGAHLVAHILSKFCLVRPVAEGTDIGIDLYCETIEERQGFLHFWAQVKSGKQVKIENGKGICQFEVDHLRYWEHQPVPVFAFYVRSGFPPKRPKQIFMANLSGYLMRYGIPQGKYKDIGSDLTIDLKSDEWHEEFLLQLKLTTSHLPLKKHGIIASIPELTPSYVLTYCAPLGSSRKYAKQCLGTIRSTLSGLVSDAALLKHTYGIDPDTRYFAERLVPILKMFEEGKRPEILWALSLWFAVVEQDTEKASQLVDAAIESINGDPRLDETMRNNWRQEFETVVREIINNLETIQKQLD